MIWVIAGINALAVAVAPSIGLAQEYSGIAEVEKKNILSTNPILDIFAWFNVEYERKIGPTGTVGLAGSVIAPNEEDIQYISVFYRFYPQERALSGFFVGGRIIVGNFEGNKGYGFGIDIAYSWLLGKNKGFSISLGIGAARLFDEDLDESVTFPTLRLVNIGFAF
ncbi:MAG: DUF3575 domain-containing protein [Candidatus Latescibacterota bacterium]|nr:MAG: DUF3575 domain-containing protein [Candidatus Latescibacterota bacterium]